MLFEYFSRIDPSTNICHSFDKDGVGGLFINLINVTMAINETLYGIASYK